MSETNYTKLIALGIPLKKMSGQAKTICPNCSHTRKHKNEACLSVNIDEGVYSCHNNCGFQGNVNYNPNHNKAKKQYVKPVWNNNTQLSDQLVSYWTNRGISQRTLISIKMAEGLMWMPQTNREEWTMQWAYFRKGELINIKYRGQMLVEKINEKTLQKELMWEKIFRLVKDAEKIFYNIDAIENSEECLITEGEPDCDSFTESGYEFAISVPNGATKANNNLDYLDNCIEYFENKKKIYIGVDNDEAGRALQKELIRRLGAERCWILDYADCKDGNAFLMKYGKLALAELPSKAKVAVIEGIIEVDDVWEDVLDLWKNGLQPGPKVGVKAIDEHISFPEGYLTVVTGKSNGGKSPYVRYLLVRLAVLFDFKIALFSPEDEPIALHISNIISLLIGKSFENKYGSRCTLEEVEQAREFIRTHFYFISKGKVRDYGEEFKLQNFTVTNILSVAKKLIVRYGINFLVIDPWNKIKHTKTGDNWDQKDYISDQLDLILEFDELNGVHTFLIAHPTKIYKDKVTKKYPVVTLSDISGAAEFETKPQMGISGYRDYEKNTFSMYVLKMKHKHIGQIGMVEFTYDYKSGRFNVLECAPDNTNWLHGKPLAQGYNEPSTVITEANAPDWSISDVNNEEPPF